MPPHTERSPTDWQLRPLAAALIAAGMLAPSGATAATLTVNTLAEASISACTVRDAVHSVNAQADQGACIGDPGSGAYGSNDTIVFAPALSGTITFAASDPLALAGPSALSVQRPVSLMGPGSAQMLLTCGSTAYRLLEIASSPTVAVSGLTIAGCVSGGDGAGMLVTDKFNGNVASVVHLTDVVVHDNHMVNSANIGGGIAVNAGNAGVTLSLTQSSIFRDSSAGNGGAIGIRSVGGAPATVAVSDSVLSLNSARSGGSAAVQGLGASIQLTRSTLDRNAATTDGGGILVQGGVATVRDTTVWGNQASGRGGGVAVMFEPSTFAAINSTLSSNRAGGVGGGISARGTGPGAITLRSATLTANLAPRGAGIMVENAVASALLTPANVVAINTIVAGNNAGPSGFDVDSLQPDSWDVSFSVIGNVAPSVTLTGAGNITGAAVPPLFGAGGWLGPLQDNGGPTLTHELLTAVVDPAVNAGNSAFSALSFDQRGKPFTRVREGRIDIGAFESGPLPVTVPVPAPAGWTLAVLSALLGLTGLLRRRRRR
ncbi:MAG TPA: choice-of-anchor Q domain-containing protein [Casimicrobiaceae bacterium]|nr:choice-of-anchor Q domain-containing protein [Casimicrobiaceae bacterium]